MIKIAIVLCAIGAWLGGSVVIGLTCAWLLPDAASVAVSGMVGAAWGFVVFGKSVEAWPA